MLRTYCRILHTLVVLLVIVQNLVNITVTQSLHSAHLDLVFKPLKFCDFIITASSVSNPGMELTMRRLAFHSALLERTVQIFTEPALYNGYKTFSKYSVHCYVQLQVTLETDAGKLMNNPLLLSVYSCTL